MKFVQLGRRAAAALLAVALTTVITLLGTASVAAPARADDAPAIPAAETSTGLQLQLTKIGPASLGPEDDLVITGTAHNPGTQTVGRTRVRVRLRSGLLEGRDGIDEWLSDGQLQSYDQVLPGSFQLKPLPPGTTQRFKITVPAGRTGLPYSSSAFGPRGIALVASSRGTQLAVLRTTIVWAPIAPTSRTKLSLLVPITSATPSIQAGAATKAAAQDLLPGARLQRLLSATSDPAMSWAIDPALLTAAQSLLQHGITVPAKSLGNDSSDDPTATPVTVTPSGSPTTASPNAPVTNEAAENAGRAWLTTVEAGLRGRTVLGLPYADPDLTSVLRNKKSLTLLRNADSLGKAATLAALGSSLDTTVAWPGDGKITSSAITGLAATKRTAVLLAAENQTPEPELDYTPNAEGTVRSGRSSLTSLLYDEQLSTLVSGSGSTQSAAADTQTLLAQLAAIALERPGDTRQVLAVTPRTWNPTPAGVQDLTAALRSAPWVKLSSLTQLRKANGPSRSAPTYRKTAVQAELPVGHITGALALSGKLDGFAPVVSDPLIIATLREEVASLLSVSWRGDRNQLGDARRAVAGDVDQLVGGVQLLTGATKLFTARSAPIPVSVSNRTGYPVKVRIRLSPQSGQLIFEPSTSDVIELQPGASATVSMKARAVGSGNVVVDGKLLTTTGKALGTSKEFTVRVRPDWESRGMIVAAVILGLLLVIGLLRSIRKERPRVPLHTVPDVDEAAATRAAEAAALAEAYKAAETRPIPIITADLPAGPPSTPLSALQAARAARAHPATGPTRPTGTPRDEAARAGERGAVNPAAGPVTMHSGVESDRYEPQQPASYRGNGNGPDNGYPPSAFAPGRPDPLRRAPDDERGNLDWRRGQNPLDRPDAIWPGPMWPGPGDAESDQPSTAGTAPIPTIREPIRRPGDGSWDDDAETGDGTDAGAKNRGTTKLLRSSSSMAAGTAVSRLLGFVRAAVLVAVVQPGPALDSFTVANTVPNAIYLLLAAGVLNAVLVPQITRAAKRADGGQEFIDRLLTTAVSILLVVTLIFTLAAPLLIHIYATDSWKPPQVALATAFALWCLPQVFWYGVFTLLGQVLNARGSFAAFGWAPVVNNVVSIAGLLIFMVVAGRSQQPIDSWTTGRIALLAGTATLGIVAQAVVLIPALRRAGVTFKIRWGLRGFGLRTASRVAGWTFAAIAVQQMGYVVISRVATSGGHLAQEAGSHISTGLGVYSNAILLFMLPHSLVTVSLVTALFTRMSVSAADNRIDEVRADLSLGLRLTGLATVVSAAAFLALGPDFTATLFAGNSRADTNGFAYVTMAMIVGLVPFSAQYLFQRVFYAFEDAKTPFLVQVPINVTWTIGNLLSLYLLHDHPGYIVVGIGVSMTIANTVGAVLSFYLLHRRFGSMDGRRIGVAYLKMFVAATAGAVVAVLLSHGVHAVLGDGRIGALTAAVVGGVALLAVYVVVLGRLRLTEINDTLMPLVRRRRAVTESH